MYSPADPIFWIFHANIDKVYHDWQMLSPKNFAAYHGTNQDGTPAKVTDALLFYQPSVYVKDLFNITELCYAYEDYIPGLAPPKNDTSTAAVIAAAQNATAGKTVVSLQNVTNTTHSAAPAPAKSTSTSAAPAPAKPTSTSAAPAPAKPTSTSTSTAKAQATATNSMIPGVNGLPPRPAPPSHDVIKQNLDSKKWTFTHDYNIVEGTTVKVMACDVPADLKPVVPKGPVPNFPTNPQPLPVAQGLIFATYKLDDSGHIYGPDGQLVVTGKFNPDGTPAAHDWVAAMVRAIIRLVPKAFSLKLWQYGTNGDLMRLSTQMPIFTSKQLDVFTPIPTDADIKANVANGTWTKDAKGNYVDKLGAIFYRVDNVLAAKKQGSATAPANALASGNSQPPNVTAVMDANSASVPNVNAASFKNTTAKVVSNNTVVVDGATITGASTIKSAPVKPLTQVAVDTANSQVTTKPATVVDLLPDCHNRNHTTNINNICVPSVKWHRLNGFDPATIPQREQQWAEFTHKVNSVPGYIPIGSLFNNPAALTMLIDLGLISMLQAMVNGTILMVPVMSTDAVTASQEFYGNVSTTVGKPIAANAISVAQQLVSIVGALVAVAVIGSDMEVVAPTQTVQTVIQAVNGTNTTTSAK